MSKEAMKLALEALEGMAQDNLRDHGDNCFLHDEGEYNRCFCGKDSLSNHLQSVVEKLDEALNAPLADQPAQQEPVVLPCCGFTDARAVRWNFYNKVVQCHNCGQVYTSPPAQRTWVGLTDEEIEQACVPLGAAMLSFTEVARAIEAKLREKNQ